MIDEGTFGTPFACVEADTVSVLEGRGAPLIVCANEPPWSSVRSALGSVTLAAAIRSAPGASSNGRRCVPIPMTSA